MLGMDERINEILDIHCKPDRADLAIWKEKIAEIARGFRGVVLDHNGDWLSVGFPDEANAWEACKAIHASGEYVAGPFPADDVQ
jgi:hypothetical protein